MAVPKRKTSKARRDKRRSANSKLNMPNLSTCPNCNAFKQSHIVCNNCGMYNKNKIF